jgi:antirestriction protein
MHLIDLRDIIEHKETDPDTYEAWRKALWEDAGYEIADVAENEPTLIPEDDFTEYAQELAEEIGAITQEQRWPTYCIDWERAARELKMDYTSVEVNGITYYFRAF